MYRCYYESPIGRLVLVASESALTGLRFADDKVEPVHMNPILERSTTWLDCYFYREKPEAGLPLEYAGTSFQTSIWDLLLQIPYGQSITYGQLAEKVARQLGKERMSAQAVGQAVSSNPIGIIIPCHRVLRVGNQLGGYAWGTDKKAFLLDLEEIQYI